MKKTEFRLSMPNRGSWNSGWSGAERNYVIYKNITDKKAVFLGLDKIDNQSWGYHFGDGWSACVKARVMNGERKSKSDGFCGYSWMVDEILWYNEIRGKRR